MKTINIDALVTVAGGMRWEDLPPSENVEDRRGMSRRESMRQRSPVLPPPVVGPRTPGDLPSQIGLDDLEALGRKLRRRR